MAASLTRLKLLPLFISSRSAEAAAMAMATAVKRLSKRLARPSIPAARWRSTVALENDEDVSTTSAGAPVQPLTALTEEETMLQDSGEHPGFFMIEFSGENAECGVHFAVASFANDVILPRVRAMDESGYMEPEVIKGLFDNGVRTKTLLFKVVI